MQQPPLLYLGEKNRVNLFPGDSEDGEDSEEQGGEDGKVTGDQSEERLGGSNS